MIQKQTKVKHVICFIVIYVFHCLIVARAGVVTPAQEGQTEALHHNCKFDSNSSTLDCSNLNLYVIPNGIPNSIQLLNLSYNQIEQIDDEAFNECSQSLKILDLSHNKIKNVRRQSFKSLESLQTLHLNSNNLQRIERDTFEDLHNLTRLNLANNPIELQEDFLIQTSLLELNLDFCNIQEFPEETFKNLIQLENLTLAGNPIDEDLSTSAFSSFQKLIKLRIPNLKEDSIISLCNNIASIDIVNFDEYNISCTVLSENPKMFQDAEILNEAPEKPKVYSVMAPTTTSSTTTPIPPTTTTAGTKVENATAETTTKLERMKINTNDGGETETNSTKLIDSPQIDIDNETINLILLVIIGVTLAGLLIGLICRIDICGIKTKLCRSKKSKASVNNRREPTDTVSAFEEIPLNTVNKSAEAEGQG